MVKMRFKHFLHNEYDLYKLQSFRLVVETSSLWHYMFWSLVRISIQGGLGPLVCSVVYRSLTIICN
jgi:hypothetical protein